jgi:hypothetical protein
MSVDVTGKDGASAFKDPTPYIPWGNNVVSEKLINVSLMRTC